jgi:archaellum biogenesis ATPase FlaH
MEMVTQEAMEHAQTIFGANKQDIRADNNGGIDVEAYLNHYGREIVRIKQNGNSTLYCLKECVFDPAHVSNESAIGKTSGEKLFYQCFHESCKTRKWDEARKIISGDDSLKLFLSNCLPIYREDRKDRKINKEYQGITEGGIENPLDRNNLPFDPLSIMKKGSDLMTLDIHVEWIVDKLIPKQSITLLHGRGGIGKTWITLVLSHAVSKGLPFMGLETVQCPVVYVDYENSLPVLVERVKKIEAADVLFWHNTNEMRPPKIDAKEWELYKALPVGLLVYDTLRASQSKDENDSRQMAEVMTRLKELRDAGFTILLLHHTPKGNDQTYKGSTAILDLADHVLSLHKVRKGSLEESDDEETENVFYRFGTKGKTRYEPFHIFLEFQKEHGFVIAPDPDTEELEEIYDLLQHQKDLLKQSQVYDLVKTKLSITSKGKVIKLLNKGIGKYWETRRAEGRGRAVFYCPIVQPYIDKDNRTESESDKTKGPETSLQSAGNTVLSFCPSNNKTERTEIENDVFVPEIEEDISVIEGVKRWNP